MSGLVSKQDSSEKPAKFGDLGVRLISAAILVALAVGALYAGGALFAAFWLITACAVNWEWQGLLGESGRVLRAAAGGVGLALAASLAQISSAEAGFAAVLVFALFVALAASKSMRLWALGGVLYSGMLVVVPILLRDSEMGAVAIAWLFAIVWGSDVFAYFGGRFFSGPKLWPRVSAGKTWSGTITGLLAGALLGLATAEIGTKGQASGMAVFFISVVTSAASQLGDLAESAIKRRFGVKDSSRLIPGHGGVMDRIDGFIFAAAFAAALGAVRGLPSVAAGLFFW
ncbi:MAG TPA: phosphatidate cytidylyltransferase [Methylocystis sp.]|nr:phosphatidate cytidylyltransferase [Methylocystis sp.]